jgi:hypothetical protein
METIKKTNVPMCILLFVAIRMLFSDASVALSVFGLGAVALFGYQQYLDKKFTKSLDQTTKEEIETIRNMVSNVAVKQGFKPEPKANMKYF